MLLFSCLIGDFGLSEVDVVGDVTTVAVVALLLFEGFTGDFGRVLLLFDGGAAGEEVASFLARSHVVSFETGL